MKKNTKLPTILGVIVLLFGLVAGIYLINSRQEFKLSADVEPIPKNVRITNISDSSATVSWTTDIESNGFVKWGSTAASLSKVALEETTNKSFVHSANIIGAENNASILFKINSDSKDYDNGGTAWQTKTNGAKITTSTSLIASGVVLSQDGSTPAKALVYISLNGVVLSTITSDEGTFVIPISTYINTVNENTAIEVTINAGSSGTAQAVIYPKAIKAIPTIIIGKTYDFRSLTGNESDAAPKSSVSVPESVEISSRFEVQKSETQPTSTVVTLESIDNGEIITTTDPEFFGDGPKNTTIEIAVESELQEVSLSTDSSGKWKWSPPNDLEPGEHKVTLKWKDASGILRTLTRTFIVQASEGPAFESTPSATPLVEATSSPSASTKPSSTPKVSSTAPPTPETGDLTPTIGLFLMGIGILLSSMFVWNKSNVN